MAINWRFIGELEGSTLTGYVPDAGASHSGVTVGSGVDLGQLGAADMDALPRGLADRLSPFLGLHGQAALAALQQRPLAITADERDLLNARVRQADLAHLTVAYGRATGGGSLDKLPEPVQTVLASVTFQYGSPWDRTPHFWAAAVAGLWQVMISELRDFGDRYSTRHHREADYLAAGMHLDG